MFSAFYQTDRYMVQNGLGAKEFYTYLTEMKVKSIITNPASGEVIARAALSWQGQRGLANEKSYVLR